MKFCFHPGNYTSQERPSAILFILPGSPFTSLAYQIYERIYWIADAILNIIYQLCGAFNFSILKKNYTPPYVLAIDIGSSSVKAALYDADANRISETEAQAGHELHTTSDGGAVKQPEHLIDDVESAVDVVLRNAGEMSAPRPGAASGPVRPLPLPDRRCQGG